jgi:hypothetical protein
VGGEWAFPFFSSQETEMRFLSRLVFPLMAMAMASLDLSVLPCRGAQRVSLVWIQSSNEGKCEGVSGANR